MNPAKPESSASPLIALNLPGGGARGAYQVGVLQAIQEFNFAATGQPHRNPFPIITGTSAGAINASVLASHGQSLADGVEQLKHFWCQMQSEHIFRTDLGTVFSYAVRWFCSMYLGFFGFSPPRSLLDNAPLADLLATQLDTNGIRAAIASGALHAIAVTASGYTRSGSACFFQGHPDIQTWHVNRHEGVRTALGVEHLMASSALPLIFPATRINNEYYADGGMRQTAPLRPAIQLGAEKILVISTRDIHQDDPVPEDQLHYPSLGEVGGAMMDIIFLDNLAADLDRLERINKIIDRISAADRRALKLRRIQTLAIMPSEDVRKIAYEHSHEVPGTLRFMLRRFGASGDGNRLRLPSYLLFEPGFCRALIKLGYRDAYNQRQQLETFLEINNK